MCFQTPPADADELTADAACREKPSQRREGRSVRSHTNGCLSAKLSLLTKNDQTHDHNQYGPKNARDPNARRTGHFDLTAMERGVEFNHAVRKYDQPKAKRQEQPERTIIARFHNPSPRSPGTAGLPASLRSKISAFERIVVAGTYLRANQSNTGCKSAARRIRLRNTTPEARSNIKPIRGQEAVELACCWHGRLIEPICSDATRYQGGRFPNGGSSYAPVPVEISIDAECPRPPHQGPSEGICNRDVEVR